MCTYNEKEILSTLQFGQRAKSIKNSVHANIERSAKELERLLDLAEIKITEYEKVIRKLGSGSTDIQTLLNSISANIEKPEVKYQDEDEQIYERNPSFSQSKVGDEEGRDNKASILNTNKVEMVSIGCQTSFFRTSEDGKDLKSKPSHEDLAMLEEMNLEEELLYLQKLEEETIKKLEEEETNLKNKLEKEIKEKEEKKIMEENINTAAQKLAKQMNVELTMKIIDMHVEIEKLKREKAESDEDNRRLAHDINEMSYNFDQTRSSLKELIEGVMRVCESCQMDAQTSIKRCDYVCKEINDYQIKITFSMNNEINGKPEEEIVRMFAEKLVGLQSLVREVPKKVQVSLLEMGKSIQLALNSLDPESANCISLEDQDTFNLSVVSGDHPFSDPENNTQTNLIPDNLLLDNTILQVKSTGLQKEIEVLSKKIVILQNQVASLKKKSEEIAKQSNKRVRDVTNAAQKKLSELRKSSNQEKLNLMKEIEQMKFGLSEKEKLFETKTQKFNEMNVEMENMKKIIHSNDHSNRVYNLETHIKRLAIERQTFFNMKFDLEKQIGEKDELLTEKDIQIGMMKSQMNILIKEIEQYKKNNANAQPLSLLTPTGIVKKIRGGNHNSGILTNSTPLNTDFSDSATLETGRGSCRFTDSKNVGRVKSPPPITLFTSRTNPRTMNFDQNAAYKEAMDQVTLFSSAKQKTQVSFASQKQKEEEAIILKGIEDYKKRNQSRYKKEKEPNSQRSNDSGILGQFKNIFTGQNND